MKKMFYSFLVTGLIISGGLSTVSAANSVDTPVNVTLQGQSLDLVVNGNINFGIIPLTGEVQTVSNIENTVSVTVSDKAGDTEPWYVQMSISELQNGGTALTGQAFNFTAAGSAVTGDGVTAGTNVDGFAPGTSVNVLQGDATAPSGNINLVPGFLDLSVGASALAGTYTGTATFSVVTTP